MRHQRFVTSDATARHLHRSWVMAPPPRPYLCALLFSDPPRACLMPQQIGWLKGGARWCGDFHIGLHRCPCRPPRHFKDGFPGSKYIDLEDPILFSMHFRPTPTHAAVWCLRSACLQSGAWHVLGHVAAELAIRSLLYGVYGTCTSTVCACVSSKRTRSVACVECCTLVSDHVAVLLSCIWCHVLQDFGESFRAP